MKINGVIENTYFKIHIIDGYICNLFLVEYGDRLLLLDCGSINDVKRIEWYCASILERPLSDIKLAIVSHNHPDHAGGASILRKKYGIPLAAHPRVDYWYEGPGGFLQHIVDCYLATFVAYRKKTRLERILFDRRVNPDFILQDGDSIPYFPEWQALHIPGHTMSDIALYNSEDKILYPGDCLMNLDGKLCLPIPVLFPDKMAASLQRMAELEVNNILPAHGQGITPADSAAVFAHMQNLIHRPLSPATRFAYQISLYSPEYRKYKK